MILRAIDRNSEPELEQQKTQTSQAIVPPNKLNLQSLHPEHGYNVMREICELGLRHDEYHLDKLSKISEKDAQLARETQEVLFALDIIYAKLKSDEKEIDLTELEGHQDALEQILYKAKGETGHSPLANLDLATVKREQIETEILPQIEHTRRKQQNEVSHTSNLIHLALELFIEICRMLSEMGRTDQKLGEFIQGAMRR